MFGVPPLLYPRRPSPNTHQSYRRRFLFIKRVSIKGFSEKLSSHSPHISHFWNTIRCSFSVYILLFFTAHHWRRNEVKRNRMKGYCFDLFMWGWCLFFCYSFLFYPGFLPFLLLLFCVLGFLVFWFSCCLPLPLACLLVCLLLLALTLLSDVVYKHQQTKHDEKGKLYDYGILYGTKNQKVLSFENWDRFIIIYYEYIHTVEVR